MSSLELKVTADTAGLLAIKRATNTLRNVLTTSRLASAADIDRLTTSLIAVEKSATKATVSQQELNVATTKAGNSAVVSAGKYTALRDATRGVAGAAGSLWMAYGQLVPLMGAYAATATSLKGLSLAADFEFQTQYINTLAEATGDYSLSLKDLRENLLDIRGVTDAPGTLAEASKQLVKAGFSSVQATSEIADMSKTATVVQEDLAVVTEGVAAQFRAWGVAAVGAKRGVSSLKQTANMMGFAAQATATDFSELNQMMDHTTELGPLTNASFAEITAALGHMTNIGIRGTKVATALRTAMLRLEDPKDKVTDAFDRMGVSFSAFTEEGEMKNLTTLFEDLGKSLAQLSSKDRIKMLNDIFQLRALKGGVAMLGAVSKSVDEGKFGFRGLVKEIKAAGESMAFIDVLFEGMSDTTKFQIDLLQADTAREFTGAFEDANGALRGLIGTLRDAVNDGSLRDLLDGMATVASGVIQAAKHAVEFKEVLIGIGGTVVLGKILGGLGGIIIALWRARTAAVAFNLVASANPYIWVAGVIIGLVTLMKHQQQLKDEAIAAQGVVADVAVDIETLGVTSARVMEPVVSRLRTLKEISEEPLVKNNWVYQLNEETGKFEHQVASASKEYKRFAELLKKPSDPTGATAKVSAGTEEVISPQEAKINAWKIQNAINVEKAKTKAKADLRQQEMNANLTLSKASLKAQEISEDQHIAKVRALRKAELNAQISDNSLLLTQARKAKAAAAKFLATDPKAKTDQTAYTQVAKTTAEVVRLEDQLAKLSVKGSLQARIAPIENTAKANAFALSIRNIADATEDLNRSSRNKIDAASLSDSEASYRQQLSDIEKEKSDALRGLRDKGITEEDPKFKEMTAGYDSMVKAAQGAYSQEELLRDNSAAGAKKSFADYAYAATDTFSQIKAVTGNVFTGLEDALVSFVQTGKLSFKDLADSIIAELIRIATERALAGLLDLVISVANPTPSPTAIATKRIGYADGGVLSSAGLSKYSGSVVSQPTIFPFAQGVGLMGEEGDEAILPLKRGNDGKLGVASGGASGGVVIYQNIMVDASGEQDVEARVEAAAKKGAQQGYNMVLKDLKTRGPVYKGAKA